MLIFRLSKPSSPMPMSRFNNLLPSQAANSIFFWNKARTEIPVPPVYLYCSTPQNLVGAEYILMEVAPWGFASKLPASSISFALLPTWRTSCPHSSISWPRSVVSLRRFPAMISDLGVFVSRIRVPSADLRSKRCQSSQQHRSNQWYHIS